MSSGFCSKKSSSNVKNHVAAAFAAAEGQVHWKTKPAAGAASRTGGELKAYPGIGKWATKMSMELVELQFESEIVMISDYTITIPSWYLVIYSMM